MHSTVTSASGRMMHRVMRTERKLSRQSSVTEPNSARLTHLSAAATASLVAAITPTLPLASWKRRCSLSLPALKALIRSMMWLMVEAWWSSVYSEIGMAVQVEFISSLPRRVANPTPWAICARSSGMVRHLMKVSALPWVICPT
ncbi:hypothetical protein D9M69_517730 [compost metagenome]